MTNTNEKLVTPVITKQEFALKVERLVRSDGLSYIEAIIQICSDIDVDPEDIAKMVVGPLKDKLEVESMERNVLPRSNTSSLFDE